METCFLRNVYRFTEFFKDYRMSDESSEVTADREREGRDTYCCASTQPFYLFSGKVGSIITILHSVVAVLSSLYHLLRS